MLILEIALTVAAWKRGWKALALLPPACVLGLGFALGLSSGSTGMSQDTATHLAPLLDIMGIVVLGVMVAARKPINQLQPPQVSPMSYPAPQASVFVNPVQINPVPSEASVPPSPFAQPHRQ